MQYASLGRSGLQVSRLSLGTMNFGFVTDQGSSFAIMDAAVEAGINFIDTADVYGGPQSPDMEKGYGISEEIWQAMELLVQQGKVIYVGSSNFAGWDIATAQSAAAARHFMGLVSEQSLFNLSARTIELEVIPACRHYGLGLVPWSPLAGGLLGGALGKATEGRRADSRMQQQIEQNRSQLESYEALCREVGEGPADVALAWLLHNPVVTAPIIGPRTATQLTGSLRALEISLSDETLRQLDGIWPGPGGEAPKAYAW
jgi:aryl-alcohol dehydrogenase-like predicted oxidoreductase